MSMEIQWKQIMLDYQLLGQLVLLDDEELMRMAILTILQHCKRGERVRF